MNIWIKSIGIGLAAAIITFFLWQLGDKNKKAPVYKADFTIKADSNSTSQNMNGITGILKKRLKAGNYDVEIKQPAGDTVVVSVSGFKDSVSIKEILTSTAKLQFREVYTMAELSAAFTRTLEIETEKSLSIAKKKQQVPAKKEENMSSEISSLLDTLNYKKEKEEIEATGVSGIMKFPPYESTFRNPGLCIVQAKDTGTVRSLLMNTEVTKLAPADFEYCYGRESGRAKVQSGNSNYILYAVRLIKENDYTALDNAELADADADIGFNKQNIVNMKFTHSGAQKWAILTRKNVGKPIAILFDQQVLSAPVVESELQGGAALLSGGLSLEEAKTLAQMLRCPPLPYRLSIISSAIKRINSPLSLRLLLGSCVVWLFFTGLSYYILKTLKST